MGVDFARLIAGGLLALICCYGGLLVKRHYAEREKLYRDAEAFAARLKSEISSRKTPLPDIISEFCEGRKGEFAKCLAAFGRKLRAGVPQDRAAREEAEETRLRKEEKRQLSDFLSALGKTALREQIAEITRAAEEFAAKRAVCAEESRRLGGMYFKLAVLVGIALIVMLA